MNNKERLGSVLDGRMKRTSGAAVPVTVELGVINSNLSLSTDSLKTPIPKGDYMIDITLKSETYNTKKTSCDGAYHDHRLPEDFRSLQGGDRVLVVWCGNEPIVTAIVTSS